jgi:hypothetical protein
MLRTFSPRAIPDTPVRTTSSNGCFCQRINEGIQLVGGTGKLDGIDRWGDIHDLATEDIGRALEFGTGGTGGLDLDQHQLAFDMGAFGEIHHLDHFNQLVELLGDLLDLVLITTWW